MELFYFHLNLLAQTKMTLLYYLLWEVI